MSKLTAQEIIDKAKEQCNKVSQFAYGDFDENLAGECEQVDSTGGEDRGSYWSVTYHFKDHDVYLKVTGYYQSHHGTDFDDGWDCVKEVKPTKKTITIYE